jgi:hypothetical protein
MGMTNLARLALALLLLSAMQPVLAQAPLPLLDIPTLQGLSPQTRAATERFLRHNLPRALALGPNNAQGHASRPLAGGSLQEAERAALTSCQQASGGQPCQIIARDLEVVMPGRAWRPPAPPADARIASWNHETVADPRFLWWGPQAAAGVVVFAHGVAGNNIDSRGGQPQPWVRWFNNARYDVWRFDRHPNQDETQRAASWLRADLAELRRRGYRRIVIAGWSRGGWNALMMLNEPGLADVAIAIAPGIERGGFGSPGHMRQLDDLRRIVDTAAAPRTRVAAVHFRDDPYDADPARRAEIVQRLRDRVGALLVLDGPENLPGHDAAWRYTFSDRYGACLLAFATAATPRARC